MSSSTTASFELDGVTYTYTYSKDGLNDSLWTDVSRESQEDGQMKRIASLRGHRTETQVNAAIPELISNLNDSEVRKFAWC
jgi:hypothetical protein